VTDINAVISGENADPVGTILVEAFGETGSKVVLFIVLLSFLSCAMSLQAAASRLAYSYGRDKMIMGSGLWSKFSPTRHVPPYALLLAAVIPALIVISAKFSTDALTKIISFAALGIYIAFAMVVLAALRARLKGWGMPVTVLAIIYQIIAMANLAWPRTPDASFVDNYIVAISALVVIGIGLVYMVIAKPYDKGEAPHGDAIDAGTWEHDHKVHTIESI
jgi:amino acid transporter